MSTRILTHISNSHFHGKVKPHNILSYLGKMASVRRERRALSRLDTHLLTDIGISKPAAKTEATRPVWDVPDTWRA